MAKKFEEYDIKDIMELAAREFAFNRTCACGKPMGFSIYEGKDDGKPRASKMCYDCNMAKKDGGSTQGNSQDIPVPVNTNDLAF